MVEIIGCMQWLQSEFEIGGTSPAHVFAFQVQLVVLVSAFVMVSTV